MLKVSYYKKNYEKSKMDDWREKFEFYANVVPAGLLLIDMVLNKIKLKLSHVRFTIYMTAFYLALAAMNEASTGHPVYVDNLNFFCKYNVSYLYVKNNSDIYANLEKTSCDDWSKTKGTNLTGVGC